MFDYMTVQEAATKWGISERRIQKKSYARKTAYSVLYD